MAPFGPLVVDSLQRLAERGIDPGPEVYRRLFARWPEFESLFMMGQGAKGHMLDEVVRLILDFADTGAYAGHMLAAERINHENLGVPSADFLSFLDVVAEAVGALSGAHWTPAHAGAWHDMAAALKGVAAH